MSDQILRAIISDINYKNYSGRCNLYMVEDNKANTEENVDAVVENADTSVENTDTSVENTDTTIEEVADPEPSEPAKVTMKLLLEAGVHFGHQTKRWHPKMKPFVFTERNGIHIIDLQKTLKRLERAAEFIETISKEGKTILFVGTKKQAQDTIKSEAERSEMPYVTHRWLGGTLTNFSTIRQRIAYLLLQEDRKERGEFAYLPKKESGKIEEQIIKLNRQLGGIKDMQELPGAMYVIDAAREGIAIAEARKLGIPIVAIADTDCNVDLIDYPIPGNDDAIRAIKLMTETISQSVIQGKRDAEEERNRLASLVGANLTEQDAAESQLEAEIADLEKADQ